MQLHELQRRTANKRPKRVGRGGLRGKTSGRGHKGQKARAGGSPRPEMRDIIKRLPKRRGYGKNRARTVHGNRIRSVGVNVASLEGAFKSGETVAPGILVKKGLVKKQRGRPPRVKILSQGNLSKKLTVTGCLLSEKVREKITKAGGTIK